jgi:catechol 2,3-dioxygenase-like lactoylglutathione lyase family enzyme
MISGLDHVTIFTSKPDETRRFFAMFGLEPGPRPAVSSRGDWLYCGKNPIVHLAERTAAFEPAGAIDHFSLRVDDYDGMLAMID